MGRTKNDSSTDCGNSSVTNGLERMFRVTEFDHPEHHTYKWTKLECEWINDRIRTAMCAEREACATVCEEVAEAYRGGKYWKAAECIGDNCAEFIRMRSNV